VCEETTSPDRLSEDLSFIANSKRRHQAAIRRLRESLRDESLRDESLRDESLSGYSVSGV
jgi:hypothetical protein